MLVACTKPYLVLTHTGYARLSLEQYMPDTFGNEDKINRTIHLTNAAIQKMHPKFKDEKESTIMSMA